MALLELLRMLSPELLTRLRRFLQSPYFTAEARNHRPESILGLFDFLQNLSADAPDFDRTAAFEHVFPGKNFAPGTINALASALSGLVKKFIALEQNAFLSDENRQALALAQFFRAGGHTARFEKAIENLLENLTEKTPRERDPEFLLLRYRADLEMAIFRGFYHPNSGDLHLNALLASLDQFYADAKSEHAASLFYQRRLVGIEPEEALPMAALLSFFQKNERLETPAVRCFAAAAAHLLDPENELQHFTDFQALLQTHHDDLPPDKLKKLCALERNFCVTQYLRGREEYLPRLFELYQRQLAEGFLYEHNCLTQSLFLNIVRVGLRLRQLDWVKDFLDAHPPERIAGARRPKEVYDFNMALYFFHRGDWAGTLRHLQQGYEDNYYILDANILELKLYFERRQWSLLDSKLNSFKVNLFKKSKSWLPGPRFQALNQFLNFLRQAMSDDIAVNRRARAIELLLKKIEEAPLLAEKDWLTEKLEALRG